MSRRYNRRSKFNIKANSQVRYPKIRVIDEQGDMIGVMPSKEAYLKAKKQNKDLVLITDKAKPPVAKIIELSKYKYQLQQKKAQERKSQRSQQTKEVRFTMFMGEGDLKARINRVRRFLEDGDKVRMSLMFKGREITKKEFAYELFSDVLEEVREIAEVESNPRIRGRKLIAMLRPAS